MNWDIHVVMIDYRSNDAACNPNHCLDFHWPLSPPRCAQSNMALVASSDLIVPWARRQMGLLEALTWAVQVTALGCQHFPELFSAGP
mmetsp:Transcript_162341/g.311692  ORF Transcript_162341/g.311692 Transcript_162341/m.311692 type:complete len:87 (-) Transcript_162341:32-292(-)